MNKWGIIAGLFWGMVGLNVGIGFLGPIAFGGFVMSPFAGLLLVRAVPLFATSSKLIRIFISVASVLVGAAIFGLGVGVADLFFGPSGRISRAVVVQSILGVLWGVMFLNFYLIGLFFWPASYCTYLFLIRKMSEQKG